MASSLSLRPLRCWSNGTLVEHRKSLSKVGSLKQFDIDQVLAEIRDDVAKKRAEGMYPPGLEQQLEAEFQTILSFTKRGVIDRTAEITVLSNAIRQSTNEITGLTPAHSRIPGMSVIHRIIRRLVARQTMGLAAQVRASEEHKVRLLEILAEQSNSHEDADQRLVASLSKHVLDRIAVIDHLAILVTELEAKIRKIEESK
jgi:hypothetical protein